MVIGPAPGHSAKQPLVQPGASVATVIPDSEQAARFHVVMFLSILTSAAVLFTVVDPVTVTEYSVVFSAIALPLTCLSIRIVANDPEYMGD